MEITVKIDELRSSYKELIGYILEAPRREDYLNQNGRLLESQFWGKFNSTLRQLNLMTQNKYADSVLVPQQTNSGRIVYVDIDFYRSNLLGLIYKIHSDFFNDEPLPITKSESGKITINQEMSLTQNISINLFKEQIEKKLKDYEEGSNERSFLEKLKNYVSTTSNITDIVKNTFDIARKSGLTLEDISKIFS